MRHLVPLLLLAAACGSGSAARDPGEPPPKRVQEQEEGLAVERDTEEFTDQRPVPRPTAREVEDFQRIWELYRTKDRAWTLERDRFKRRSDAAGYLLAAHLLRYYIRLNAFRDRAAPDLVRVKDEIVDVGEPCVTPLVDLMVLDRIPRGDGKPFLVDDLTRQDCLDMLERIGPSAVPGLLRTLKRKDLGVKARRYLALALGGTHDGRGLDPLVRLLKEDPSWQVRADAATALGDLGDRRAIPPLTEAVRNDPDPHVVKRAGKARFELLQRGA